MTGVWLWLHLPGARLGRAEAEIRSLRRKLDATWEGIHIIAEEIREADAASRAPQTRQERIDEIGLHLVSPSGERQ